jgi:hypothetical protein
VRTNRVDRCRLCRTVGTCCVRVMAVPSERNERRSCTAALALGQRAPSPDEPLRAGMFRQARNPEGARTFLSRPALGDAAMGEQFGVDVRQVPLCAPLRQRSGSKPLLRALYPQRSSTIRHRDRRYHHRPLRLHFTRMAVWERDHVSAEGFAAIKRMSSTRATGGEANGAGADRVFAGRRGAVQWRA